VTLNRLRVGDVVAYLLSDEASYLTGVAPPVDGGHLVM
jgi:NAD(P)-dependent dehydrogenase (short-subunit alcohol dehydrogenase family)